MAGSTAPSRIVDAFKFALCVVLGFTTVTYMTADTWIQPRRGATLGGGDQQGSKTPVQIGKTVKAKEPAVMVLAVPTRSKDTGHQPRHVPWPQRCATGAIRAVFPNSSVARSQHMNDFMHAIGGCGMEIPAVMRDDVISHKEANGAVRLVYENETILFSHTNKLPRGNIPNAATHSRMLRAWADAEGVADNDWAVFFEDDAQLHANVLSALGHGKNVADLLQWTFKVRLVST